MFRRRVESLNSGSRPGSAYAPTPTYPHVTSHRSLQMELRVYSPSVKVSEGHDRRTTPLFADDDQIGGVVNLDPSCAQSGRLTVSIEGAFTFKPEHDEGEGSRYSLDQKRHVFFTASNSFQVSSEIGHTMVPTPPSAFRLMKRRPSASSLRSHSRSGSRSETGRSFPFTFELPKGVRANEQLPPSLSLSGEYRTNAPSDASLFGVDYKILVSWEPYDASEYPSFLEVPFLYHYEMDFESLKGLESSPAPKNSWLEMPLRPDRPVKFKCAVTLPSNMTFSRNSTVPFFVVFTTTPRNHVLAAEIATDATISVSVLRQIVVTEPTVLPPTPPDTPSDTESIRGSLHRFRRAVTSPLRSRSGSVYEDWTGSQTSLSAISRDKPLPAPPSTQTLQESKVLFTSVSIGFPKRPKGKVEASQKHPTLDEQDRLPDRLHRSKIPLKKQMVPCMDWRGLSVKYYLDFTVTFGQDEFRARVPIRIT